MAMTSCSSVIPLKHKMCWFSQICQEVTRFATEMSAVGGCLIGAVQLGMAGDVEPVHSSIEFMSE